MYKFVIHAVCNSFDELQIKTSSFNETEKCIYIYKKSSQYIICKVVGNCFNTSFNVK